MLAVLPAGMPAKAMLPAALEPFLQAHCHDCHGRDVAKGGLDLEALGFAPKDAANARLWERIHDRVERGEMPPSKRERPPQEQVRTFLGALAAPLIEAGLERRPEGARTRLRRLNVTEFLHSLEALLGPVTLPSLPAEDTPPATFDTLDRILLPTAHRIEQYLETIAEAAAEAGARLRAPTPLQTWVINPRELTQKNDLQRFAMLMDRDDLVVYLSGEAGIPTIMTFQWAAPARGWYRIRVLASAHNSSQPEPILLRAGPVAEWKLTTARGYAAAPVGAPDWIEFNTDLNQGHGLRFERADSQKEIWRHSQVDLHTPHRGVRYRRIEVTGPYPRRAGLPAPVLDSLAERFPRWQENADQYRALLAAFTAAAHRCAPEQAQDFVSSLPADASLEEALRLILSAGAFLLRWENPGRLDPWALAARLSYFLTSAPPDAELRASAADGSLLQPKILRAQTDRLLDSPAADVLFQRLADQWLDLRNLDATAPDARLYPPWDRHLHHSVRLETETFLARLLRQNEPVTHLIAAPYVLANERLARHYRLPGVEGEDLVPIPVSPDDPRGGLWTHASILKVSANGTTTSPILRGVWITRHLLDLPPPPPPPGVPAVEPDIRGATTLRQQLEMHTRSSACAGCHQHFDPYGWALEAFDPTGAFRRRYTVLTGQSEHAIRGPEVQTEATLPDGTVIADIQALRARLLQDPLPLARALVRKLAAYGTGHDIEFADRPVIEAILEETLPRPHRARDLLHRLVQSRLFLEK